MWLYLPGPLPTQAVLLGSRVGIRAWSGQVLTLAMSEAPRS